MQHALWTELRPDCPSCCGAGTTFGTLHGDHMPPTKLYLQIQANQQQACASATAPLQLAFKKVSQVGERRRARVGYWLKGIAMRRDTRV